MGAQKAQGLDMVSRKAQDLDTGTFHRMHGYTSQNAWVQNAWVHFTECMGTECMGAQKAQGLDMVSRKAQDLDTGTFHRMHGYTSQNAWVQNSWVHRKLKV
jgi:hypothetical protein